MRFLKIVGSVTERTIEMVLQVPFLQTFLVKDVQAFQLPDLLRRQNRFKANNAATGRVG